MVYRVKELAEAVGLDAAKLARRADLSYPSVRAFWREDYAEASTPTLAKIARALEVPIPQLFRPDAGLLVAVSEQNGAPRIAG